MRIFLTFDYELFLSSKTGTVENCLIRPTEDIIETCNKYNVKTTFFVDTTYLCKAREYKSLRKDYLKVCNQLKKLSIEGHSIQLHIHPQWFYSTFDETIGWIMDYEHYKLSDCPMDDVHRMFDEGLSLIYKITGEKCVAYRAGGYSIQTLPNYADFLRKKGLKIDSSCICNKSSINGFQKFDYTTIRKSDIYTFSEKIENPNHNGDLIELPITTYKINPVSYAILKRSKCKGQILSYGDGESVMDKVSILQSILNKIRLLLSPLFISASIDRLTGVLLPLIYDSLKKKSVNDFTLIIHPKGTTNFSLLFLDEFLKQAKLDGVTFYTIKNIECDMR